MGLGSSTTGVVLINGKDRQAGEVAVHEDGVRRLQAKEHQGVTATTGSYEARKGAIESQRELQREQSLRGTLQTPRFGASSLQNGERMRFCCSKPPGVRYFITAALENQKRLPACASPPGGVLSPEPSRGPLCGIRTGSRDSNRPQRARTKAARARADGGAQRTPRC